MISPRASPAKRPERVALSVYQTGVLLQELHLSMMGSYRTPVRERFPCLVGFSGDGLWSRRNYCLGLLLFISAVLAFI